MKVCPVCGGEVTGRGTFDTRACATLFRGQRQREELAREVEWLLRSGESPAQVAARLHKAPEALARTLARGGRPDLARPLWRVLDRSCVDCGRPCSRRVERCQPCGVRFWYSEHVQVRLDRTG